MASCCLLYLELFRQCPAPDSFTDHAPPTWEEYSVSGNGGLKDALDGLIQQPVEFILRLLFR